MIRRAKVRAVATFEFRSTVRSVSWIVVTVGMPVFLLLYGGLVSIPAMMEARKIREIAVYAVVDEAGILGLRGETTAPPVELPPEVREALRALGQEEVAAGAVALSRNFVFRPAETLGEGSEGLRAGRLRGYYRIPADYVASGLVEQYGPEKPDATERESRGALRDLLVRRLLEGKVPADLGERIANPVRETRSFTVTAEGEVRSGSGAGKAVRLLVPMVFVVLLLLSVMSAAGGLLQATAIEKENKVVDILLSSASADEILVGKLLGQGAAGAIQMSTWFGVSAVAGVAFTRTLALLGVDPPWAGIVAAVFFFPLAYLFFGSLMLGTGSIGANQREANQWGMLWALPLVIPMIFLVALIHEPHGTIARVLTWVPFTSPITAVFRLSLDPGGVAWWEIAGSVLVLLGSIWLSIGIGARLFRVGILLTGSRPKLREILRQARLS